MVEELESFLKTHEKGAYDRENFDKYCAKRKLFLSCPVIHITGSNGKGSTAHYLEAIYLAAGYHVALFSKPFFYKVNETMRFDGKEISDEELAAFWADGKKDFEKFGLTSFEANVALAYRFFESKKPDIAIIEAGMGGVIDATNIDDLDTRLAIITSISLEHTSYLGTTLSQIALHKAGIIKPDSPVLLGKMDETCLDTIREEARKLHSNVVRVESYHFNHLVEGEFHFDYGPYKDVVLNTTADYQLRNACLAIEATRILQKDFPVEESAVRSGLANETLPGRMERFGRIVLDGAHNPEAVECLCRCVPTLSRGKPVHVLFASFRDKNIAVELPSLANVVTDITLTTFDHPRARTEDEYFLYISDHPFVADAEKALEDLLVNFPEDTILITGSLNFVGLMRELIVRKGLGTR